MWEGKGVVVTGRKLVGATNPLASGIVSQSWSVVLTFRPSKLLHMSLTSTITEDFLTSMWHLVLWLGARGISCVCFFQSLAASVETLLSMWAATSSTALMQWRAASARLPYGSLRAWLRTSPRHCSGSTSRLYGWLWHHAAHNAMPCCISVRSRVDCCDLTCVSLVWPSRNLMQKCNWHRILHSLRTSLKERCSTGRSDTIMQCLATRE